MFVRGHRDTVKCVSVLLGFNEKMEIFDRRNREI